MSDDQASKSMAKANILGRVYLYNLKRSLWNKSVFYFLGCFVCLRDKNTRCSQITKIPLS